MISLQMAGLVAGTLLTAVGGGGVFRPAPVRRLLDTFPRHRPSAVVLLLVNVIWVTLMVYHAPLGRFEWVKPFLFILAPVTFFAVLYYMEELLAPRMLGGLLLLAANPALNAARWHESAWRLVLTTFVYFVIVWAMILVLSPYRFRYTVEWCYRGARRVVAFGSLLVLGVVLLALSVAVY